MRFSQPINWRCVLCAVFCLMLMPSARAASGTIDPNHPYPEFQGGVTGAWFQIDKGHVLKVHRVEPNTPADGKQKAGGIILKIAAKLGHDAGPIIGTFEHCLKQPCWNTKNNTHVQVQDAMKKAIEAYRSLN